MSENEKSPTILQIAKSVVAAAFGVQSSKNHERDFARGNPLAYILGGIIFTVLFVLAIMGVVSLVLP
ncbi:MAG: DUF2970 domain-containing protein [Pseudomonadales bacterium]|nr:DUF2970 domain-containing protein [Pseudomonadales bacterium]